MLIKQYVLKHNVPNKYTVFPSAEVTNTHVTFNESRKQAISLQEICTCRRFLFILLIGLQNHNARRVLSEY